MTRTDRLDPPQAATEFETLLGFLNFHRATIRRKASGLTAAQLHAPHPPSTLTLGRLVGHLAYVEDTWFTEVLQGRPAPPPFDQADWAADSDWEMTWTEGKEPSELLVTLDAAIERSDSVIELTARQATGLDTLAVKRIHGGRPSLRWILVHMIEEYSRHNGHADLLREAIDGSVGE